MATNRNTFYTLHQSITVAQCLLKYLELEEVDVLFGIPGAAVMYLLDELKKQNKKYVVCRQETGAAYMADGYARLSGKLGVVLVTSGPGATNALTGAVNAQSSNSSVLVISGEVPEEDFGKGYLQEGMDAGLDVNAVYRAACQYTAVISNCSDFQTLFAQAIRSAMARPRRTTHISLPQDISGQTFDAHVPVNKNNYRTTPACSAPQQTKQALQVLLEAELPLLFLGAGCREALVDAERRRRFQQFVEKLALPVMASPGAKGLFPESHPLSLRTYGLAACEWPQYYLRPCRLDPKLPPCYDCLAVFASSLGELATNLWNEALTPDPKGAFLQVDLDQGVLGRAFPISMGIVAEIGCFLDDLLEQGRQTVPDANKVEERRCLVQRIKKEHSAYCEPDKRNSDAVPILPQALMKCLSEELPPGSHVFIDAGNCVGWALHYLDIDPPTQAHSSLAMGPMGFGVASVIGAKLAAPDRVCVGIVGDGAFLMHGNEVSTAAQYQVGAIWVVLFDNDLAMVSQGMDHFFPGPGWTNYYALGNPDLAKFAEALGASAYTVKSQREFRWYFNLAVKKAESEQKPQVILVHHDLNEKPPYYPPQKYPSRGRNRH
jgi:acetolactate synthase-1/2/3 large subunit